MCFFENVAYHISPLYYSLSSNRSIPLIEAVLAAAYIGDKYIHTFNLEHYILENDDQYSDIRSYLVNSCKVLIIASYS